MMFKNVTPISVLKSSVKLTLLLLALCVLAIVIVAATLNTQKGRLWVTGLVTDYINENTDFHVELKQLKFPTLGHLKSSHILVTRSNQPLIELKQFDFNWQPFALLDSKIVIHNISADDILLNKVTVESDPTPAPDKEPVNLSKIDIPQIILKRINIKSMTINGYAPAEYDGIPFSLSGNAKKINKQPVVADLKIQAQQAQGALLTISLSSHGLNQATLKGQLNEPAGGKLSALLRLPSKQNIDSSFRMTVSKHQDRIEATIDELSLPLSDHELSLNGDLHISNDLKEIKTNKLVLIVDQTTHTIEGGLSDSEINLAIKLNALPLDLAGLWVPSVNAGWLSTDLKVSGTTSSPLVTGSASAKSTYNTVPIFASFAGSLNREKIIIKTLKANISDAEVSTTGHLDLVRDRSNIKASLTNFNLATLKAFKLPIPDELSLTINKAQATLTGNLKNPSGTLEASSSGSYKGQNLSLTGNLKKNKDQLDIAMLQLKHKESEAHVGGKINLSNYIGDIQVTANNISLEILELASITLPPGLSATADMAFTTTGKITNPFIEGKSKLIGRYQDIPFVVETQGKYSKQKIELTNFRASTFNEVAIEANGFYQNEKIALHATINKLPAKLLSAFGIHTKSGQFNSNIDVSGTLTSPMVYASANYQSTVQGFNDLGDPEQIPFTWNLNIDTENQQFSIVSKVSRNNQNPAEFKLGIPIEPYMAYLRGAKSAAQKGPIPMDVSLSGSLDLQDFSFFIDPDLHRINGKLSTALHAKGTLEHPNLNGSIRLENVVYENPITGSLIENMNCQLNADGTSLSFEKCAASDGGKGSYSISGAIELPYGSSTGDIKLNLNVKQAHIVRRSDIESETTGKISLSGDFTNMLAQGDLEVTPLTATFESSYSNGIPSITVEEASSSGDEEDITKNTKSQAPNIELDLSILAQNQAFLRGRGLEVELEGKIDIHGNIKKPLYNGVFQTVRGDFEVFNKKFNIERGQIYLTNNAVSISITGIYKKNGQSIQVNLSGTNEKLDISFSAIPTMPEDEILAFLIFGKSIHNMTAFEAIQLANSIQTLRGGGSGFDPIASTRKMLGVDTLSVESATTDSGESGINVGVGKYINEKVYLELQRTPDPAQPWKGNLEIELSPTIHLNSSTGGSTGLQGAEITWDKDY